MSDPFGDRLLRASGKHCMVPVNVSFNAERSQGFLLNYGSSEHLEACIICMSKGGWALKRHGTDKGRNSIQPNLKCREVPTFLVLEKYVHEVVRERSLWDVNPRPVPVGCAIWRHGVSCLWGGVVLGVFRISKGWEHRTETLQLFGSADARSCHNTHLSCSRGPSL